MVSVLTPAEILMAAQRLAGARPHLAAVAGGIHHLDDLDPQTGEPETTDMTEPLVWVGDHQSAAAA
jgi:hypothetical protein